MTVRKSNNCQNLMSCHLSGAVPLQNNLNVCIKMLVKRGKTPDMPVQTCTSDKQSNLTFRNSNTEADIVYVQKTKIVDVLKFLTIVAY